jgi:Zn finger protein HypA/HybF involved in hydrogenase expression
MKLLKKVKIQEVTTMLICRNCSQTFNSDSTEKVEAIETCPKCEEEN